VGAELQGLEKHFPMTRWLKRLAIMSIVGALAGLVVKRRTAKPFDPTRPAIDWGTTSLRIDDA
jgi:hypothetical protein